MREQNNTGHFTNRDTTYIMAHIYHSATLTCCLALDVDGKKVQHADNLQHLQTKQQLQAYIVD